MTRGASHKLAVAVGVLCLLLGAVILGWAEGLRRWYSGGFFVLIGAVMVVNALRWRHEDDS